MISAVIDTNVLVSAFWCFGKDTPPMRILRALVNGAFTPLISDGMMAEYRQVLSRKRFDFDPDDVAELLDYISRHAEWKAPAESDEDFPDSKDKVFYCTALAVDDAKIVTGNLKHFPKSPIVVAPAEFCDILGI